MYNEDMQLLLNIVGPEAVEKIMCSLGGLSLYVPRANDSMIKHIAQRDRLSPKQLSVKLGLSERKIRQVLSS